MGLDNCGRGGLAPEIIAAALRLLAREERLSDQVIARRVGCSHVTVWKLRRGRHASQRDGERSGPVAARQRLAQELLAREPRPSLTRIGRLLGMHFYTVQRLAESFEQSVRNEAT